MNGVKDNHYDAIVIGCGGIGSAALYWLSKLGKSQNLRVLGLEQFALGHVNGSSHDVSRIIRYLYWDPAYIKLAPGAYASWNEVEEESGVQLVYKTGGVLFTLRENGADDQIDEYIKAMDACGTPYEMLDGPALEKKFPQFRVGQKDVYGLYQEDSGLVHAEMANAVHVQLARSHGAEVLDHTKVLNIIKESEDKYVISTEKGDFSCRHIVMSTGAWNNEMYKMFGFQCNVSVTQEQVTYFATPNIKQFTKSHFPTFMYYGKDIEFYGIPMHGNSGLKIGTDGEGKPVLPNNRNFDIDLVRVRLSQDFVKEIMPDGYGPVLHSKTCLYELTPDKHFILDSLASKGHPNIYSFMGCGHGFKFACVVGKIFAQLILTGKTEYPLSDHFKIDRKTLDPTSNFKGGVASMGRTSELLHSAEEQQKLEEKINISGPK